MEYSISLALSEEDRLAVYRFRYEIYVEEMGRRQTYADHAGRMVEDPLDQPSCNLFLARNVSDGAIVGTVRSNYLTLGSVGDYESLYNLPPCTDQRRNTSLTTRLMTNSRYRRTRLALDLAEATYLQGLHDEIQDDIIDCNAHLLPFFSRLGYRVVQSVDHPDYGQVLMMNLCLSDRVHLASVRSPFLRILDAFTSRGSALNLAS